MTEAETIEFQHQTKDQMKVEKGPGVRSQDRALYDFIVEQSLQNKLDNVLAYPGYLRAEALLGPGSSQELKILRDETVNGAPVSGVERRLETNDAFYVTAIAVMVYSVAAAVAGGIATEAVRARARLQRFPNTSVFGLNTPEVVCVFNGRLTVKQNEKIFLRDMDLHTMQYADTAQEGQVNTSSSAIDGDRAFRSVRDPLFRLNGFSNIEAQLDFPAPINPVLVAATSVYAVLYMTGWRAQNGGVARSSNC